ncbi:MAG: PilZ domain-containing protein [Bdellovibrionales bacterium]|nr:PilZ domain-containing protein [Bdellovibrionales bacterium]
MQKILVISDSFDSLEKSKSALEEDLHVEVFGAFDLGGVQSQLNMRNFHIAIIDHAVTDDDAIAIVEFLKNSGMSFPVLIITDKIQLKYNGKLNMLQDIHVMVRPVSEKNVVGLTKKLLKARQVPKQNFRRFNTNQIAEVEDLASGNSLLTSMYNLSKGGAYCEFDSRNSTVAVGDLFRMKVFITDTNSEYTFSAKVVWTTPKGRFSGRYGCGFKFVNPKDVYRSQLSKV